MRMSNFIIYHVVDGVRKLARSNTMATSTPLEEPPAALAKRIEDFVSAIERPIIAVPAARLAGYQLYSIKTLAFTHSGREGFGGPRVFCPEGWTSFVKDGRRPEWSQKQGGSYAEFTARIPA
jgi:hypothetical protein